MSARPVDDPLAEALADDPRWWGSIIDTHTPDGAGLCSAPICRRDGVAHDPHPCAARSLAERARAIHQARQGGRR